MTQIAAKPQGVWAWILQRITAVLLLLFLGTHIFILHYVPANMSINFLGVAARLKSVLYFFTDGGLLAVGLYHALNGLRNILFDYAVSEGKRKAITILMVVIGIAFLAWGAVALAAFMK
jgi:succinate dehydrogenase / fumarate reductase, membrane anchor subunit